MFAFAATSPAKSDRGFCYDIRRAARSGPDLVAEGYYRFNPREFHRFLNDAKASLGEVRNQLLHANDERFLEDEDFREMSRLANRATGAANGLQKYLRSCPSKYAQRPKPDVKRRNQNQRRNPELDNPEPDNPKPEPEP